MAANHTVPFHGRLDTEHSGRVPFKKKKPEEKTPTAKIVAIVTTSLVAYRLQITPEVLLAFAILAKYPVARRCTLVEVEVGIQVSSDAIYTLGSLHIRLLPYYLHSMGGLIELAFDSQPCFIIANWRTITHIAVLLHTKHLGLDGR